MTEHHGWQVPACFTSTEREAAQVREGVGLGDLSWMARFELKGYGLKTPAAFGERVRSWTLAPLHLLLICDPATRESVLEAVGSLHAAASDLALPAPVYWNDMTPIYAQFLLAGPRSREVLRKLTSLNLSEEALPDLGCGQTSLAHAHAMILREDRRTLPAFHLLVGREYGESIWDALMRAGREFRLEPFGLQAQTLLGM